MKNIFIILGLGALLVGCSKSSIEVPQDGSNTLTVIAPSATDTRLSLDGNTTDGYQVKWFNDPDPKRDYVVDRIDVWKAEDGSLVGIWEYVGDHESISGSFEIFDRNGDEKIEEGVQYIATYPSRKEYGYKFDTYAEFLEKDILEHYTFGQEQAETFQRCKMVGEFRGGETIQMKHQSVFLDLALLTKNNVNPKTFEVTYTVDGKEHKSRNYKFDSLADVNGWVSTKGYYRSPICIFPVPAGTVLTFTVTYQYMLNGIDFPYDTVTTPEKNLDYDTNLTYTTTITTTKKLEAGKYYDFDKDTKDENGFLVLGGGVIDFRKIDANPTE